MTAHTRVRFNQCEAVGHAFPHTARLHPHPLIACEHLTELGNLCEQHAHDLLGVRVAESDIEGAGLGLFTTRARKRGEWICTYLGRVLTNADYFAAPDWYSVQLSRGRVLSASWSTDGFARYANNAQSTYGNNCLLMTEAQRGREWAQPRFRGSGVRVGLIAGRAIEAEAELCVSYGNNYWRQWRGE
jgi:hypothetical protein